MYSSFKQFLVEEEKVVYFTFGRMNPPTIGHGKLLDKLAATAGRNPYKVFLSQSQDAKKNPLSYSDKVKYVRKMFPKHARQILLNKNVKTAMDAAVELYNQGFRKAVLVVGSDRVREFDVLLNKYNGQKARHGFYNFKDIKVVSAGDRDPDAEGVEGMSASKMRGFASENDFTAFSQGLPKSMSNADAKRLFNDVRKGMGLKEEKEFKNHVQLDPVSQLREAFVAGEVLNEGDMVVLKGTDIVAEVSYRGSNYVIVEGMNGQKYRKWLTDVELLEQDNKKSMYKDKPDWGTPESTKKAKKMTPGETVKESKIHPEVVKAYKKVKDAEDQAADYNHRSNKARVTRAQTHLTKKINQHHPEAKVGSQERINLYTKLQNIKEGEERKKESPQDPDIKDRPGTQPKAYHKGVDKSKKAARDRHFKRGAKMDDDNPKAYKPAPGDKGAETKPSKHTKRFKQMFGEEDKQMTAADITKMKIDREKKADARRHDRMMDRARMRDTKKQNRETDAQV